MSNQQPVGNDWWDERVTYAQQQAAEHRALQPSSKDIIAMVAEARQQVIRAGGRPTTLKVSIDAIEKTKIFGMDIEVVSSVVMPKGVDFMVIEDKDKIL